MPPSFQTTPAPAVTPNALQNTNPQSLLQSFAMNDILNDAGRNVGNIGQEQSALQGASAASQSASQNRSALQALSGFQQALSSQGGTGGLSGMAKEAEAEGGGVLGGIGGGLGGAATGAAIGSAILPGIGTVAGGLLGGLLGGAGGKSAGNYLSSKSGPGQFENIRQSTASEIAAATGMPEAQVIGMLPDYGENATQAQTKLNTLQTILSGGYSASVQPAGLGLPSQQSFGNIGLNSLSNIAAGTGKMASAIPGAASGVAETSLGDASSLADLPEEALSLVH